MRTKSRGTTIFLTGLCLAIFAGENSADAGAPYVELVFEDKCTDMQSRQIAESFDLAYEAVGKAVAELGAANPSKFIERAVDIWFGVDADLRVVLRMYRRIYKRMHDDANPISIICDHREDLYGWTWMETDDEAYIGFGRVFFQTQATGGFDTRMGTVVHELSHMVRDVASDDIVYGISGAQELALQGDERPFHNADSYEYLVEMLVGGRPVNEIPD